MNNKGFKLIKTTLKILSYLVLLFLFLLAGFLLFYIITNAIAKKNGTKPLISMYTIVSPSMEPTIMTQDVIIDVRASRDDQLNKDDIITFYTDAIDTGGYTVTHRILKKYAFDNVVYYETKGDNNSSQDVGRITINNIVGKYWFKINGLGKLQYFISSKIGWIIIILIPALFIIISDILKLIKAVKIKGNISNIKANVSNKRKEKEKNKKYIALIEKADEMNKK